MNPTTPRLQLAFRDASPGETAICAALEAAQRVLERNGMSPREAFAAYQALASGTGGPDTPALTLA